MKYSGKLLSKEEREYQYGWISKKYSTALACLAGDDIEIKDGIDARPPKPDTYVPFEPEVSLSVEDIIDIHNKMIDDFGGEYGIRDEGLLESIRNAPYSEFFGTEQYPEILDKAAKYLFDFTYYQVFVDGNKRTGLAVLNAYLAENDICLTLSAKEAYELVMGIANHKYEDSKQVVPVLEKYTKPFG